jgi:D-xylose transport system substrate-binding protein
VLAAKAAENAVALARGKPLIATATVNNGKIDVPSIFNSVYTVTKENMRETVIKDGFHSEAAVFGKSGG